MYYTKIFYYFPDYEWKVCTFKLDILDENDEFYEVEESEDFHIRSNTVYKSDKDDVASSGYTVLNYAGYCNTDLTEGFACCVSLTPEEGIEILKEAILKSLKRKIDFFNDKLINLNNIK